MDRLTAALAFDRALRTRAATKVARLPGGIVVLNPQLPSIYHLNAVLLDSPLDPALDAEALGALADAHLAECHHRQLVIDDARSAERVEHDLLGAGWTRQRTLYMVLAPDAVAPPADSRAQPISDTQLRQVQRELFLDEGPAAGNEALAAELVAAQDALRAGTPARCFGAFDQDTLASSCTLFCDGGVAIIDEVGTLTTHRQRGLARAVVGCAVREALAAGCAPIIIPADADDWPQLLYASLGFEGVGRQVTFTNASPDSVVGDR